jgi:hypothetical protein
MNNSNQNALHTPQPTLEDMLGHFDIGRHGGEVMAYEPIGRERFWEPSPHSISMSP